MNIVSFTTGSLANIWNMALSAAFLIVTLGAIVATIAGFVFTGLAGFLWLLAIMPVWALLCAMLEGLMVKHGSLVDGL